MNGKKYAHTEVYKLSKNRVLTIVLYGKIALGAYIMHNGKLESFTANGKSLVQDERKKYNV